MPLNAPTMRKDERGTTVKRLMTLLMIGLAITLILPGGLVRAEEEKGADEEKAQLLAHLSTGRPGYALRLLEDEHALDFRNEKLDEFSALLSASRVARFAYAEKLAKDKETFRETLLLWLSLWRDVMLFSAGDKESIVNIDRSELIEKLANKLSLAEAKTMLVTVENGIGQLKRNVNARLLAEVVLLGLPR